MSQNYNLIGLDRKQSETLAQDLNVLLAHYQVMYSNARGFHWNIQGRAFFELHVKFEEIYTDLQMKVDEIAERILTLGYAPEHRFSQYLQLSDIDEHPYETDGIASVQSLVNGFSKLIILQRRILSEAGEAGDEGTASQMGDYIREQEKLVWMLNAYLQ